MKYEVIDERQDMFNKGFNDKAEALEYAKSEWDKMAQADKDKCKAFYVLESVNPDEESENHFDGDVIIQYK